MFMKRKDLRGKSFPLTQTVKSNESNISSLRGKDNNGGAN